LKWHATSPYNSHRACLLCFACTASFKLSHHVCVYLVLWVSGLVCNQTNHHGCGTKSLLIVTSKTLLQSINLCFLGNSHAPPRTTSHLACLYFTPFTFVVFCIQGFTTKSVIVRRKSYTRWCQDEVIRCTPLSLLCWWILQLYICSICFANVQNLVGNDQGTGNHVAILTNLLL